jgi:hypothetical protein
MLYGSRWIEVGEVRRQDIGAIVIDWISRYVETLTP